jgi:hypothetical protein
MLAIDQAAAARVARLAGGSPGLARKLVSQGFLEQLPLHEAIWTKGPRPDGQGAASPSDLLDLARSATDGSPAAVRRWLGLALHVGASHLRDLLASREGEARCHPDRVVELVEDLIRARVDLDGNVNPAVLLADLDLRVREAHLLAS